MIISLFGPDGVGKSTVGKKLADLGWLTFSGTNVSAWPDQSWHEYFVGQGIDESKIEDNAHFLEKIKRVHQMAHKLEAAGQTIVIDSNPLHKTLMHDYKKQLSDKADSSQRNMADRFQELSQVAGYDKDDQRLHVFFAISEFLSDETQAAVIQERLSSRTSLSHFDPKSLEESLALIRAAHSTSGLLISAGERVVTIYTDRKYSSQELGKLLG